MAVADAIRRAFVIRDTGEKRLRLAAARARGRVLDIGCAEKPNPYLAGDVTAYDLFEPDGGFPPNYARTIRADVADLRTEAGTSAYDTVVALEVIEHLTDHCAFIEDIAAVLVPGGLAILSTPNPYYWTTMAGNVFARRGMVDTGSPSEQAARTATKGPYYGHIHLHLPRVLNRIAHERGLDLVSIAASTGWNAPFLATNLMYIYRKADSPAPGAPR